MSVRGWLAGRKASKNAVSAADELGNSVQRHVIQYLYSEEHPSLASLQDITKQCLTQNLTQLIGDVFAAENPESKLRETLSKLVHKYAAYTVLSLTEAEKERIEIYDIPLLSGQLHHHISELANHFEDLYQNRWDSGLQDAELLAHCQLQRAVHAFYLNGVNILRPDLQDSTGGRDWLRPFVVATMIWWEGGFRRYGDMQALASPVNNRFAWLVYAHFAEFVEAGCCNPYYEFERYWHNILKGLGKEGTSHYLPGV
jgi:hypothetical protein